MIFDRLKELWKAKNLVVNFAISDLKIKYRNSVLGFFWSFLEPLLLLTVLYVVFTNVFKSEIEYYPLYILLGLIMYNMLQKGTDLGLNSISSRSNLITQLYFPRQIPALSAAITSSIMMIFELIVFGIFMIVFQFSPTFTILFLPLILCLEFILVLGICLPLSVLNVRYNDVQFIWKVVLQAGFFLTPIFYRLDILPESIQNVLKFSPMVIILEMARDVTIYNTIPSIELIQLGIGTTLAVLFIGYLIFIKFRKRIIEAI